MQERTTENRIGVSMRIDRERWAHLHQIARERAVREQRTVTLTDIFIEALDTAFPLPTRNKETV